MFRVIQFLRLKTHLQWRIQDCRKHLRWRTLQQQLTTSIVVEVVDMPQIHITKLCNIDMQQNYATKRQKPHKLNNFNAGAS